MYYRLNVRKCNENRMVKNEITYVGSGDANRAFIVFNC